MMDRTESRTFSQTHDWINFQVRLDQFPYTLWLLLGEAHSKCQHIAGVPLQPAVAKKLYEVYLAKGVHATTSIEGNTLTEEQIRKKVAGNLKLPKSQSYMELEAQNVIDACNKVAKDLLAKPLLELTPELICEFNSLVLRGLDLDEDTAPGSFRRHSVGVGAYRGAPAEDCPYLIARLCDWMNEDFTPPTEDMRFVYGLLKAALSHLYIAWIHPFGEMMSRP